MREYFGEEIALFFVWQGYLCTMLWIPAAVGIWVTFMQVGAPLDVTPICKVYSRWSPIVSLPPCTKRPYTPVTTLVTRLSRPS